MKVKTMISGSSPRWPRALHLREEGLDLAAGWCSGPGPSHVVVDMHMLPSAAAKWPRRSYSPTGARALARKATCAHDSATACPRLRFLATGKGYRGWGQSLFAVWVWGGGGRRLERGTAGLAKRRR